MNIIVPKINIIFVHNLSHNQKLKSSLNYDVFPQKKKNGGLSKLLCTSNILTSFATLNMVLET